MSAFDMVLNEVESKFGLGGGKATSLLSALLGFVNQSGGVSGLLDRFRNSGSGDWVSSVMSGNAKTISADHVESALGSNTINTIASKAGMPASIASSALAFMLPKLMQALAPGGAIPSHLPSEFMSYLSGPTAAVASGARQAVYAAERASSGLGRFLWPLVGLLALALLGFWLWNRSSAPVSTAAFNAEEQVRLAAQKASTALSSLQSGFTASALVGALNLDILNFATGSAQLPADSSAFLNQAAVALKAAPAGTVVEVGGHTDNTGEPTANLQLSQQRADAVRDYLIGQGVAATALVAKGYGDTKPVAANDTEEGKFRNRRIEFSVVK